MTSLGVILIIVIVFTIGAIKNWGRDIGAGPTILVVGMIFVLGYVAVQYSTFLDNQRTYDACVERVVRSSGQRQFQDTLIDIIDTETDAREDIIQRLRDAELPALDMLSCGLEPTFLGSSNNNNI